MWWVEKQINVCKINAKYNKLNHIIYLAPLQNIICLLATKINKNLGDGWKNIACARKKANKQNLAEAGSFAKQQKIECREKNIF